MRSIEREQAPQWGVATIEIAVSATIEDADIPYYAAGAFIQKNSTFSAVFSTIFRFLIKCHPGVRSARRKSQWLFLSVERAAAPGHIVGSTKGAQSKDLVLSFIYFLLPTSYLT